MMPSLHTDSTTYGISVCGATVSGLTVYGNSICGDSVLGSIPESARYFLEITL